MTGTVRQYKDANHSYDAKHDVQKGAWNRLRVVFKAAEFSVFFNGEHVFDTQDQSFRGPGKTGLWTKADSVIYFDDFSVAGK